MSNENTTLAKVAELTNGDATYGGAYRVDSKTGGTGKVVGAVTYVCEKMKIAVPQGDDAKISFLRKTYDKDTVNKHLAALKSSKNLRCVHSRQITALIAADQNYLLTARGTANKKGEFTGFNVRARFQKPEVAKKRSKDATIAYLQSKLAAAGIVE